MNQKVLYGRLKKVLHQLHPISQESWNLFEPLLEIKTLDKNEFLVEAGKTPKNIYFIAEGAVIVYYSDVSGKIYTKNLLFENDIPAATSSLINNSPSNVSIKTIEKSLLILINFKKFRSLGTKQRDLNNLYLKYLETYWVIKKEEKEFIYATKNATEKYLYLLEQYPNIDKRIALYHIASYLNITSTQLSRIRKELKG